MMPTYAELQAESWWGREIVTDELRGLGDALCRRTGRPRDAWGDKGNNAHLNGGHRSQEWIKNSRYCTNRTYTAQSGLSAEQLRHIAAGDFAPGPWGTAENRALVAEQTGRLWDAAKRGELTGVTQVEGTLDGRTPAGLNVGPGTTFTPDSSHLEHWHLTFDRRYLRDAALMARIADIALGDEMDARQDRLLANCERILTTGWTGRPAFGVSYDGTTAEPDMPNPFVQLRQAIEGLSVPASAPVDAATLRAALEPMLAAMETRLNAKIRDAVADLGEKGAAGVRAEG